MPFKTTIKKQSYAVAIAASAKQLAAEAAELFGRVLTPYLREGETLPDVRLMQELVGRYLEASGDQLLEVDDRYTANLRTDQDLRRRREELARPLSETLRDIRYLADRHLGLDRSKKLMPVRDLTNVSARSLVQTGRQVVTVLRDPQYGLDQAHANGLLANAGALAEKLERECDDLAQLLDRELAGQKREKQNGLKIKLAEIRSATEAARRSADFLAGMYRLVGLDFDAERLRPAPRRRKSPPAGDEEDQDAPEKKVSAMTPEVVSGEN